MAYVRDTYLGTSAHYNDIYPVIDCSVGSSQWGVSPKAFMAHAKHDVTAQAAYPDLFYNESLKPALLDRYKVEGLGLEHLFLGHGSFNLAERLIHKLIKPEVMLGIGPQFNEIPSEFVAAGGQYVPVPIEAPEYLFPLKMLQAKMGSGISLLYVDNPNNPLGRHVDIAEIAMLVDIAQKYGVIVLVDEAYGDFVDDQQSAIHLVSRFQNLAVLRSFSKGLGLAAARIGYLFLSSELAHYYRPLDVPFEPSLTSAELACATLSDHEFIERTRATVLLTKRRLTPQFEASGLTVLPTHPTTSILTLNANGKNIVEMFASISVAVEPGSAFQKTHPAWDDSYCRLRLPREDDLLNLERRLRLLT